MKWYQKFGNWVYWLFSDEKGSPSSKRFIGLLCGISLCFALFISQITGHNPSNVLVEAVALLAFGCLGLTSIEGIFTKKKKPEDETTNQ
jgi:hypothetical protein